MAGSVFLSVHPLLLVVDGNASVFLFWLVGGTALTHSFEVRPFAICDTPPADRTSLGVVPV
jgi:hypothetical protein